MTASRAMKLKNAAGVFASAILVLSACGSGAVCGDGLLNASEVCDDGNTFGEDGCSAMCVPEAGWECSVGPNCEPVCGDGLTVSAEACDPSDPAWTEYCSNDCMEQIASCGDGVIQTAHEVCDDGDPSPGDGCNAACQASFGWTCDDSGSCDATDVEPTLLVGELSVVDATSICEWIVETVGGPGRAGQCGSVSFLTNTVDQCLQSLPGVAPNCSIAQLEAWMGGHNNTCDFILSTVPVC